MVVLELELENGAEVCCNGPARPTGSAPIAMKRMANVTLMLIANAFWSVVQVMDPQKLQCVPS